MAFTLPTPTSPSRGWRAAAALVLTAGMLAGCTAAGPGTAEDDAAKPAARTSYPLTLETEFGTTVLEEAPERVVALGDLDDALALGVIPVGSFRPAGDADDLADYEQDALEAAQRDGAETEIEQLFDPYAEPDYEAIAKLNPDVILAAGYWDLSSTYAKLSSIAPVVALPPGEESDWESRHRVIASALDRAEAGEEAIAAVHSEFAEAKETHPEFSKLTLNYAVVYPTQVTFMSVPDTEASWFFSQLGFRSTPSSSSFGPEYPADVVSEEQTPLLDADIVVIGYHSLLEPGQRESFERSPLFAALPAVSGGRYIALPEGHDSTIPQPGVLSSLDDLHAVLPLLEQAVAAG